jgi:hypothetical protein
MYMSMHANCHFKFQLPSFPPTTNRTNHQPPTTPAAEHHNTTNHQSLHLTPGTPGHKQVQRKILVPPHIVHISHERHCWLVADELALFIASVWCKRFPHMKPT